MSINNFNGRVFFEKNYEQHSLYEQNTSGSNNNDNFIEKTITNMIQATPLSNTFFSRNNLNHLQNRIIQEVRIHGYDIGKQDELQLQIIQRSIFLSNSKNLYNNIQGQVNTLNSMVIEYAVPRIISEIKQHLKYLKDISSPRDFMSHPVNVNKGNKSFPLTNF